MRLVLTISLIILAVTAWCGATTKRFATGMDSYLNSTGATNNYGASTTLSAGSRNTGGDRGPYRPVFRFPVGDSIPVDAIVDSAKLSVYCVTRATAGAQNVVAYRLLRQWVEGASSGTAENGAVNWNAAKQGIVNWTIAGAASITGDRNATALATVNVAASTTRYTWNITTAAAIWINATTNTNFGVILQGNETQSANWLASFSSQETGTNPPWIDVWYKVLPVVTGLDSAAILNAAQTDSNNLTMSYEVHDNDNATVTITAQYRQGAGAWTALTPTGGDIGTVASVNHSSDRTIVWNVRAQLGAAVDDYYMVRVIATDGATYSDTVTSASLLIDTRAPTGMSGCFVSDTTASTATLQWSTVAENHFSHYEVWYGISRVNVTARNLGATRYGPEQNSALRNRTTVTVRVEPLAYLTKYFFQLWAYDSVGNSMTGGADSATTLTSAAPQLAGYDPDVYPTIRNYSPDTIAIGYTLWDADDSSAIVAMETRLQSAPSWIPWSSNRTYCRGDTGATGVSLSTNRTVYWGVRAQYGLVDTMVAIRLIARDNGGNYDTAASSLFTIDTRPPVFAGTLGITDSTSSAMSLLWPAATTENHFDHYEIWYGTVQSAVDTRLNAAEWDNDPDDAALAMKSTTTTSISGLLGNTLYYFKIWAIDSMGNETALATISHKTASFTGLQITALDDAVMRSTAITFNYGDVSNKGGATSGKVGNNSGYNQRTLVKITDLSAIPAGATITSALFNSYCCLVANTMARTVSAYRVLQNWNEGTGTGSAITNTGCWQYYNYATGAWNTQGCGGSGTDRSIAAIGFATVGAVGWYAWDITQAVRDWHSGTYPNYGMVFVNETEATNNSYKDFNSSEGANVPYLQVQYIMEPPDVTGPGDSTVVTAFMREPDSATIRYTVGDLNNGFVTVSVQYKISGGSWNNCVSTAGSIGLGIDATNHATVRTIRWNVRSQLGNAIDGTYQVRVIADDGILKDTTESALIGLDTRSPVGLSGFTVNNIRSYAVDCIWNPVSSEGHFLRYEIWYGSSAANVTNRTASVWNPAHDNGMALATSSFTRITGLAATTKYYYKIWAIDSMGNETTLAATDSATTLETPVPTVTGWNQGAEVNALHYDSSRVRVGYQVIDIDDTLATISLHYRRLAGGSWTTATSVTGKIGAGVRTGSGYSDTALWNARADLPSTTSELYQIRITAVDDTGFTDTTASARFKIDLVAPAGLAALTRGTVTATAAALTWTAVTAEPNFHHYEIWYGTVLTDVQSRSGTAYAWNQTNDAALSTMATVASVINALNANQVYYFKIWAVDSMQNQATTAQVSATTMATNDPVITGLDDAARALTIQYSTTAVRIGYEVDDANNPTVTISAQYQLWGTTTWIALTNTSGKIGTVTVSATVNDTIIWNAPAQLPSVDSVYRLQIIAFDGSVYDTVRSDTFSLDTRAPAGFAAFAAAETLGTQIRFTWIAPVERNFSRYEIWYGTIRSDVQNRVGTALKWDNQNDGALAGRTTVTTTITGLTSNVTYFWKPWAIDKIGNEAMLADSAIATKNMVTPLWSRAGMGLVKGGAIGDFRLYVGTGAPQYRLSAINLTTGTSACDYSIAAYGTVCNAPTYIFTGSKYKIVASVGTYVIGRQDDSVSSSQLFAPVNLGATAGTPYISPDDTSFFVPVANGLSKRRLTNGTVLQSTSVANISTEADMVVFSDNVYVATNDGKVHKLDAYDLTPLCTFTIAGSPAIALPLAVTDTVLYVTPRCDSLYAVRTSNMTRKWGIKLAAVNTGPAFVPFRGSGSAGAGVVYTAAGTHVQKITDNNSSGSINWTFTAADTVKSMPIAVGGAVYFGCNGGRYYTINSAGALISRWPYTSVDGNGDSGPWVDIIHNRIIYATTTGRINSFAQE